MTAITADAAEASSGSAAATAATATAARAADAKAAAATAAVAREHDCALGSAEGASQVWRLSVRLSDHGRGEQKTARKYRHRAKTSSHDQLSLLHTIIAVCAPLSPPIW
jgi:hypothetical protein